MLLYLLLYLQHYFRTFAPVFFLSILDTTPCVYRKRKLRKSIYINTMVFFKHSLPLPERFHHNFLLLSTPLLYIQPAIKLRESNQAENE